MGLLDHFWEHVHLVVTIYLVGFPEPLRLSPCNNHTGLAIWFLDWHALYSMWDSGPPFENVNNVENPPLSKRNPFRFTKITSGVRCQRLFVYPTQEIRSS